MRGFVALGNAVEYALLAEELAPSALLAPKQPSVGTQVAALTRREGEVATLVARGLTNRQVASELFISERTVDHHVAKILKKLKLPSRERVASWLAEDRSDHPHLR